MRIRNAYKQQQPMETSINRFGEIVTKWISHKHPDNNEFMNPVLWTIWEKPDGRITISYKLDGLGKSKFIYGITKQQAIELYS